MITPWETLESSEGIKSKIFRHRVVKRKSFDSGDVGDFDVIDCYNWVNIVALTKFDEVIMVKQYRHGSDSITLEIPGGAIEISEDPGTAGKRELLEETGYSCEKMEFLGKVNPNPAFMTNTCYTYLATGCIKISTQKLDHLEEIDVELYSKDEILEMLKNGTIDHSLVVSAFFYLLTKK
ncbi:MAG: NUDIX hydrolase [Bacteriovoracaceae bacterium]|nr:NUDIX hydrolase [Bacteriovoracaceae bacterium]